MTLAHKDSRQRRQHYQYPNVNGNDQNWQDEMEEAESEILIQDGAVPTHKGLSSLKGELGNIFLLLFLYILQGIPLGLAGSIPLILQSKNVSYTDQAIFSFVFWPFSLKLLWAPMVDSLYVKRFGRRKSWLVPTQYLLGLFMMYLSLTVDDLLGGDHGPDMFALTATFFLFEFLAATQDIAVDGWALTMLSRENVGYASTCNSVGQTAGYFMGNVLFLALESKDFCNKYLRSTPQPQGLVTLPDFLFYWGAVFLITTTLVALLKKENSSERSSREETESVTEAYSLLLSIVRMPAVFKFCLMILTAKVSKLGKLCVTKEFIEGLLPENCAHVNKCGMPRKLEIGFSAADAVTGLKLIERGVPKEHLALLAVPMVPLQILLPVIISKYTAGPKPLNVFLKAMPYRLLMGFEFAFLVWWTPKVSHEGGFPMYYYAVLLLSYAFHQVALYSMFVAIMAFNAKVSDPLIGGTYMTLLNTVSNLGGNWPATLALWFVDHLTSKECVGAEEQSCSDHDAAEIGHFTEHICPQCQEIVSGDSDTVLDHCSLRTQPQTCDWGQLCAKLGGSCVTTLDGYFVESVICIVIGFCWWFFLGPSFKKLQDEGQSSWKCRRRRSRFC